MGLTLSRMTARQCDIAILGGGLAGGLIALALARHRPDVSVLLVEQDQRLGGNHVWSFFGSDVGAAGRDLLAPLVIKGWQGYDVHFPDYARTLGTTYYAMTGERMDAVLRRSLPGEAIVTGARAVECGTRNVTLSDGTRIEAGAVIDARGIRHLGHLTGGWQKFVGRRLKLARPHGLERPVVMDATVPQLDGYRFVYALPFSEDEVFIEDTYYSDLPGLDAALLGERIGSYALSRGWQVEAVLGEEAGVLPVVAGGDFDAFLRSSSVEMPRAGTRAGLFHPLTSYSVPDAVRFALSVATQPDLSGEALAQFSEGWARQHWRGGAFYRMLSAMLFGAAEPAQRYKVLERFYKLDRRLIERFYRGESTTRDKMRVLAGRPPVPLGKAIAVLAGIGAVPAPLHHAGMRK